MSRKDYELIAHTISHLQLPTAAKIVVAAAFARALIGTNPLFKPNKFLDACNAGGNDNGK